MQDLIQQADEQLMDLVDQQGKIYVCGDGSQMAPAVENVLKEAYQKTWNASPEEPNIGSGIYRKRADMSRMYGRGLPEPGTCTFQHKEELRSLEVIRKADISN